MAKAKMTKVPKKVKDREVAKLLKLSEASEEEKQCVALRKKGCSLQRIHAEIFGEPDNGTWAWRTLRRFEGLEDIRRVDVKKEAR